MSETPKIHRKRAEEARGKLLEGLGSWPIARQVDAVAEKTYPAELVKAARGLCEEIESGPKHTGMTGERLRRVRAALALYEPEEG